MKKPRFRVGPIRMNTGTRIHGETKYNRRKEEIKTQREIQNFLIKQNLEVEQYYPSKNDCNCPQLYGLWELIKQIDGLALKCTEYTKDYSENEERRKDSIFMNAVEKIYQRWIEYLGEYPNLLMELHLQGHIKVQTFVEKKEGITQIDLEKAVRTSTSLFNPNKNNLIIEMFCSYCNTRLPRIEYKDWFQ